MFHTEKLVLDFKAEECKAQSTVFDVEDIVSESSTISASEVSFCDDTQPPSLMCKLKKPIIMIKKLPKHVLEAYKINGKNTTSNSSSSSLTKPSRVSKRVGVKNIPGLYLSLHVNKPLNEVLKPKKRRGRYFLHTTKPATKEKQDKSSHDKKYSSLLLHKFKKCSKGIYLNDNAKKIFEKSTTESSISATACVRNNLNDKIDAQLPVSFANIRTTDSSSAPKKSLSLHEQNADTRKINSNCNLINPVSTLPNFPDVVITKYAMPQNNSSDSPQSLTISNQTSYMAFQTPPNVATLTSNSYQNFRCDSAPQKNITVHVSTLSYPSSCPSFSQIQSNSMSILHQNLGQPIVLNAAVTDFNDDSLRENNKKIDSQHTTTGEILAIPTKLTQNKPIILDSSKILVIKQPSLRKDPLDMPDSRKKVKSKQNKENTAEYSDTETCVESEADNEMLDVEEETEPEVIKRIIYHTKSSQTKFTCNTAICGLVDSNGFRLNCFYCYKIFPLHKWQQFIKHIKLVHHVEEEEIRSDSEEDAQQEKNENIQSERNKEIPTIDLTTTPLNNNTATTNTANKKLPLEPRIVAERLKKVAVEEYKSLSTTLKSLDKLMKYINESKEPKQSYERHTSTKNLNNSTVDEIVSVNSDDDIVPIAADKRDNETTNSSINSTNNSSTLPTNEVTKVLQSGLQHITIGKLDNKSKATANLIPANSKQESLLKYPRNLGIQKSFKKDQLSANSHTKSRYFVVKKIITPSATVLNPNVPTGNILTNSENYNKDMLSSNENEDTVPKPSNGRGILFGLTNPMVVIEFLLKLKSFPELWRPQMTKNSASVNYDDSIRKLCLHLNNRFDLGIQDIEMRFSIQRVKDWYCRMLKEIYEHSKNPNNTEPYKHRFPLYFKILNQFLTSNVHSTNKISPNSLLKSNVNINKYPRWMVYKTETSPNFKLNPLLGKVKVTKEDGKGNAEKKSVVQTSTNTNESSTTTIPALAVNAPVTTAAIENAVSDTNIDNLIEFDPDTLYDNEKSDEEVLETFDKTKISGEEIKKTEIPLKKRTKIYRGHYECDLCLKAFKRMCDVRRHRVHHFPPEYECEVCKQKYYFKYCAEKCNHSEKIPYRKVSADPTIKRVWPKKIFRHKLICELCGASYRQLGSLNCHKRDKHFNQRLKCIVCHFTALTNYRIVQHQKKRHIVEPGTVEEVAKKSRARTETKTRFSTEARQEFDWRREMRKKLQPGEMFFACCKCRIIFNTRKEKVLHNKMEHPITDATVVCLLCLPTRFFLSNANSARRHYTDIHKVPWDEIDALVKRTKPIFNVLSTEEIELIMASKNYKELLEEFLKDKNLDPIEKVKETETADETINAVQNLPNISEYDDAAEKIDVESIQNEEYVYVDGIIDHDYNFVYNGQEYGEKFNEHDYNEKQINIDNCGSLTSAIEQSNSQLNVLNSINHFNYNIQHEQQMQDQEHIETIVDFVDGELVNEELVEESFVDEEDLIDV